MTHSPSITHELKAKDVYYSSLFNKARLQFQMYRSIKTWRDFLLFMGMEQGELEYVYCKEQLERNITLNEIKEQEVIWKLRARQGILYRWTPTKFEGELCYYGAEPSSNASSDRGEERTDSGISTGLICLSGSREDYDQSIEDEEALKKQLPIYLRPPSTYGFWFQNKATRKLYDGIVKHKKRSQLLLAGTGTGKTFIAGLLIEQLWNPSLHFFDDCVSPWPVVYITRASIVEQTKRVMEKVFGLDPVRHCFVLNVEQLRSSFGTMFLKEKTVVKLGESHIEWEWKNNVHPRLFILDESHLAKNVDSTQSKIIQSLSKIEKPTYLICMSATPFMRITDGCYFAVNSHKEIK